MRELGKLSLMVIFVSAAWVISSAAQTQSQQAPPSSPPAAAPLTAPTGNTHAPNATDSQIPYRPCPASVVMRNGRHACLG